MTPSVIRMVTRIYNNEPKPLRLFSIANFFRNEKPQRGRNREFWQLNYDLFGSKSIYADVEIVKIAIEIMLAFLPEEKKGLKNYTPFVVYINDRRVLTYFLEKIVKIKAVNMSDIVRILDKREKIKKEEYNARLTEQGLSDKQIKQVSDFLDGKVPLKTLDKEITKELTFLLQTLKEQGYEKWIEFKPSLVRGFDYYTGIVYETYDTSKENNRSLFGGGRYDGLGEIFGDFDIPAVGCAPGDETLKLFLEGWNLLEKINIKTTTSYYIPIIEEKAREIVSQLSKDLKTKNNMVIAGLEKQSLIKSLEYANKKNIDKVIIIGTNELEKKQYLEKDMKTGKQIVRIL